MSEKIILSFEEEVKQDIELLVFQDNYPNCIFDEEIDGKIKERASEYIHYAAVLASIYLVVIDDETDKIEFLHPAIAHEIAAGVYYKGFENMVPKSQQKLQQSRTAYERYPTPENMEGLLGKSDKITSRIGDPDSFAYGYVVNERESTEIQLAIFDIIDYIFNETNE